VVAVEVPSLTFRPGDTSADNLLSVLVFGDGAGAAVLRGDQLPARIGIGRTASRLVAASTGALGFERADDGFRVVVSRQLPRLLEANLPALVTDFIGPASELDLIALHPGGQAIVDSVARCLDLTEAQVAATRSVLRRVGNTSSAAILFVLEELGLHLPAPVGRGLAAAFGPGLTVELLELHWAA
jgi:alkylresorcinol/alkylpyrone synthase